jgi:hypothetical protein
MQSKELGLIIVRHGDENPHVADVEAALREVTEQWEWEEMGFIKDVRRQQVHFQDEVPPNPPVDLDSVVVALQQLPTTYVEGSPHYVNHPEHGGAGLVSELGPCRQLVGRDKSPIRRHRS